MLSAVDLKFITHIGQFGLNFKTIEEFNLRKGIFEVVDAVIVSTNLEGNNYTLGHNKYSTNTQAEWDAMRGKRVYEADQTTPTGTAPHTANQSFPQSWDWVSMGCVNAIKDQGQCGSCWAFSSVAALESANCIAKGNTGLYSLSEQQLVDCCGTRYSCYGCNGGWQYQAFNYYENQPAFAMSEAAYPYTATDTPCVYNASNTTGVTVVDWSWVACANPYPSNPPCKGTASPYIPSVNQIMTALQGQPLSISIEANKMGFQMYQSGVFDDTHCGTRLDHAVDMVGWGFDAASGLSYWNIRNSWGTSWGNQGYIWMAIQGTGADQQVGICGCQMEPVYPFANTA